MTFGSVIDLAVDTGINTIVVLSDFNEDQLKPQNNKMSNIFAKFNKFIPVDTLQFFTILIIVSTII
jgi:hypothetical protein